MTDPFTTRQNQHNKTTWFICSPTGMIDYTGPLNKQDAEAGAYKANQILKIFQGMSVEQVMKLVFEHRNFWYSNFD